MSFRKHVPPGTVRKQLVSKARSYDIPFKDHTDRSAMMSWFNSINKPPLPPLSCWVFYMVHPDLLHQDFSGIAFSYGLQEASFHCGGDFRYEFFFVPGASVEECVEHFRGELKARGSIWRQVHKVQAALREKKEQQASTDDDENDGDTKDQSASYCEDKVRVSTQQNLPGLVWPEELRDYKDIQYRGWFFVFPDADIRSGPEYQDRKVKCVKFDPVPDDPSEPEEGGRFLWDPIDEPIKVQVMAQSYEFGSWIDCIAYVMHEITHATRWEEACNQLWHAALEMGWETW